MEYKFSEGSEKVLNYAKDLTEELGHSYIGTEHILYGLAKNYDSVAGNILYSNNITNEIVKEKIIEYLSYSEKNENNVIGFTPKTKRLIENSYLETKKSKEKLIETEHILITILNDSSYMANKILVDLNVNTKKMYRELNDIIGNKINNNSLVLKLVYKDFSMLFTGDIEEEAESYIASKYKDKLGADILKIAHHGSKTSSTETFIEFVKPKIALTGVGENNNFGHPNEEVIKRFETLNTKVYRTDINGEISIKVDGGKILVECFRKEGNFGVAKR